MGDFFGVTFGVQGSPFSLSNTYMLERIRVLPSTSGQLRGMPGELLQGSVSALCSVRDTSGLESDPHVRTLKLSSCH